MKTKYLILLIATICCMVTCKNADVFEDKVYFSGTDETTTQKVAIEVAPVIHPISVSASSIVKEDVDVHFDFAPELMDAFNKRTGNAYEVLPAGSYELTSHSVTIKAGKAISESVNLVISTLSELKDGTIYMIPVKITQASGLPILESCATIYLAFNRTIISPAPDFNARNYFPVDKYRQMDELKALNAFTFETRINVQLFKGQTYPTAPKSVSVMGIEEVCLLRFGDGSLPGDKLQLTAFGGNMSSAFNFSLGNWYHIAVTYDGSMLRMYVDGELDATKEKTGTLDLTKTNPATTDLTQGFFIGRAADNMRLIDAIFSETRVWTVARSQNEIRNNMCYVDPETPGLLSYWRFNEGSGNIAHDLSPNGIDIQALGGTLTWVEGIRCEP
jgi:Laminin G domain./Domain of unknown function (DUF1735).